MTDGLPKLTPEALKMAEIPGRITALRMIKEEPASAYELTQRMANGAKLNTVTFYVQSLAIAECIDFWGSEKRRGAVEHFYEITDLGEALLEHLPTI